MVELGFHLPKLINRQCQHISLKVSCLHIELAYNAFNIFVPFVKEPVLIVLVFNSHYGSDNVDDAKIHALLDTNVVEALHSC